MSKPCHSSIESSRESTSSHRDISALDDHQLGMLHQGLSSSSKALSERWTGHMLFNWYTSTLDISTSLNSITPSITPTNMAGNIITVSIIVVASSLSNYEMWELWVSDIGVVLEVFASNQVKDILNGYCFFCVFWYYLFGKVKLYPFFCFPIKGLLSRIEV